MNIKQKQSYRKERHGNRTFEKNAHGYYICIVKMRKATTE